MSKSVMFFERGQYFTAWGHFTAALWQYSPYLDVISVKLPQISYHLYTENGCYQLQHYLKGKLLQRENGIRLNHIEPKLSDVSFNRSYSFRIHLLHLINWNSFFINSFNSPPLWFKKKLRIEFWMAVIIWCQWNTLETCNHRKRLTRKEPELFQF